MPCSNRLAAVLFAGFSLALLCCLAPAAVGAEGQGPIDWERVRQLYRQSQQGQTLSPADQAYLDSAKAIRRQGADSPTVPPPPKATPRTGLVPLNQMTAKDYYKGQDGGLYGAGRNQPPAAHLEAALQQAARVVPLDRQGKPSPDGKIVLLSLGMSNTTGEYSRFQGLAKADPAKSPAVVLVDGAQGGMDAPAWSPSNAPAWGIVASRLKSAGVTPAQVQVLWVKQAVKMPARFGEFPAHNAEFSRHLLKNLQLARERYPNLRIAYLSTRIYAGYAKTALNPEPYAYENAFAVRDLILRQVAADPELNANPDRGPVKTPLLLWGPYLWADGTNSRASDGLVWNESDFGNDGTHPSATTGRDKVARQLLDFLKTDPSAKPWFLAPAAKTNKP